MEPKLLMENKPKDQEKVVVLTYGTFDLLHVGHMRLLERAKTLGDYLIVGVTTPEYDQSRGKLNIVQSLEERKAAVAQLGYADLIIEEKTEGQKIKDIQKYGADIITFGSDWEGKFDYLQKYCKVVYLERTKGISSSMLRQANNHIVSLGIVGCGRIARRMVAESRAVSGLEVTSVFGRNDEHCRAFCEDAGLSGWYLDYETFLNAVDAVYIALPHHLHVEYAKRALEKGKHVLCEKPMAFSKRDIDTLYDIARKHNCVLMEAFKTLWAPAFRQIISLAQSGAIGTIRSVDATFTKLVTDRSDRVYDSLQAGGAFAELGSYPLLAISRILGHDIKDIGFQSLREGEVDIYTRANLRYDQAFASATVGIAVKREGDLVVAGTEGYLYVPAPWWKMDYFELRHENTQGNRKFYAPFEGEGLRYELAEFTRVIMGGYDTCCTRDDSAFIANIMEQFDRHYNTALIH